MYILRLFDRNDPFRQIDARPLDTGELTIGRDPSADWMIADPDRALSRLHCALAVAENGLLLRDTSANGVFLGDRPERLPPGEPVPLAERDSFRLGRFTILVDRSAEEMSAGEPYGFSTCINLPMFAEADAVDASVPSDWAGGEASETRPAPHRDASLLEAFCEGARLDASSFSGEDPAEVMRRLGAVYRQMVLGIGDLMSDRRTIRSEYRMDRTTVGAVDNNPFKWAPTQRIALDLLRSRDDGFLTGPEALKASFVDLKKHLLCMEAGSRAALAATIDGLAPAPIEAGVKGSVLKSRAAAAWELYVQRHGEFARQSPERDDGPIARAFRAAYDARLRALDDAG